MPRQPQAVTNNFIFFLGVLLEPLAW